MVLIRVRNCAYRLEFWLLYKVSLHKLRRMKSTLRGSDGEWLAAEGPWEWVLAAGRGNAQSPECAPRRLRFDASLLQQLQVVFQ